MKEFQSDLQLAIKSILEQDYSNIELIIYDDCSCKEVAGYLDCISLENPQIKILKGNVNLGLGHGLNECIKASRGEYIARMDGDDYSHISRIRKEVLFLIGHSQYGFVGSAARLFDRNGVWDTSSRPELPGIKDFLKYSPYIHPSVMFRREILFSIDGPYSESKETRRCEDLDIFIRLYKEGIQGYNLREELLDYQVDRNKYHKRRFIDRINETKVRSMHYKSLQIHWIRRMLAVHRPIISAFVSPKLAKSIKKRKGTA